MGKIASFSHREVHIGESVSKIAKAAPEPSGDELDVLGALILSSGAGFSCAIWVVPRNVSRNAFRPNFGMEGFLFFVNLLRSDQFDGMDRTK